MKNTKIPTIIGLLLVVFGVASGVFLVAQRQNIKVKSSPEVSPQNVRITNVTSGSFSVSWTTGANASGFISWGETASMGNIANETDQEKSTVHSINVIGLKADTTYFFKINSEGSLFDNNGVSWQVKTAKDLGEVPIGNILQGTVRTATGQPPQKAILYINIPGATSQSTQTSTDGAWALNIANAVSTNLTSYAELKQDDVLEVFVQGGSQGISSAKILLSSAKSTPPMVLGQTHDFRSEAPQQGTNDIPEANLDLPEGSSTSSSGFNVPDIPPAPSAKTVVLKSIDEGEVIYTTKPEFFGEAPPGTVLEIKVESEDPIVDQVKAGSGGSWNWSPPTNLPPGEHKVTLSWRDSKGILRTIVKTFTVQAAEGNPSFESTPSATPRGTATATPQVSASPSGTPRGTATPTIRPTSTPIATPRISLPSTESGIPDSGSLTPTILLTMMGLGLLGVGFYLLNQAKRPSG